MCKYLEVKFVLCGCTAKELYYLCPEAKRNCTPCIYKPDCTPSRNPVSSWQGNATNTSFKNKKSKKFKALKEPVMVWGKKKPEGKGTRWVMEYADEYGNDYAYLGENERRFVLYQHTDKCDAIARCDFHQEDWEESGQYLRWDMERKVWDC
jgi:hypothetical protein